MKAAVVPDSGRFDDVLKIAVLRGGGLGDLIFVLPALDALAAAYPEAEIVLLGTPAAAALLTGRRGPVSRVEVLPRARGVHGVDDADDPEATARFQRRMRAERFDLACQLHGGGRYSNPFLLALGARHSVGTATADAVSLERVLPYVYYQHEVFRWLETVSLAGAAAVGTEPVVAVEPWERVRGSDIAGPAPDGLVVMHPGASDPRRRWPEERFVELAMLLGQEGRRVVLIGDGPDARLADRIAASTGGAGGLVESLGGRLDLAELAGLLAAADVVVGNDSGPRHLAQAVGTATVGVFWAGNLINAGPMTRARHRVEISWVVRCPVCGRDVTQVGWTAPRCEHDVSFVADVPVAAVHRDVVDLLPARARTVLPRGR